MMFLFICYDYLFFDKNKSIHDHNTKEKINNNNNNNDCSKKAIE